MFLYLPILYTGSALPYIQLVSSSFPGVKLPWREANHSPPASTEIKNALMYASTPAVVLN